MMPSKYRAIASFGGSPDQKNFFDSGWGEVAPFDINNPKEIELRSPMVYADSIIKPLFIYIGDRDYDYLDISKSFVVKAKEYNCPCEIQVIRGNHLTSLGDSMTESINKFQKL
jgi:hypothetical protein